MRIMFVCHGNICRSPMAEFIFKKMCAQNQRNDIEVSSSATSNEEIWNGIGNPVYPPAKEILKKNGIDCGNKRATQLKKIDYDAYDLFVVMDENNLRNIFRIFGNDSEHKVKKLLDFTENGGDVADPWYSGNFEKAYDDIYRGCRALYETIIRLN